MIRTAENKEDCKKILLEHFSRLLADSEGKCLEEKESCIETALKIYKVLFNDNEPEQ